MKPRTDFDKRSLSALLTLLQDENVKVASLAMEELLKMGHLAEEAIAEHQEAADPHLRQRIHQLNGILVRRRARSTFLNALKRESISLWQGLLQINLLYDPQCEHRVVTRALRELAHEYLDNDADPAGLAAFMRQKEFTVPEDDVLDVDLYLLERVLHTAYGSPAVLCSLARHISRRAGSDGTVVLHDGRFCLMSRGRVLIDPSRGWKLTHLRSASHVHPCRRKDVWLDVLAQLYLVSLVEGNLRDLFHFGELLTALDGSDLTALPYPMGTTTSLPVSS